MCEYMFYSLDTVTACFLNRYFAALKHEQRECLNKRFTVLIEEQRDV